MAGKRIPDLDPLSGAASANDDKLVVFDASEGVTKRMDRSQLATGLVGDLPYTPSGGISATTVPTAIAELDSEAAKSAALAASDGSDLIGFIQSGSGATARTVQDKLREFAFTPQDFGAVGDGVADDTAAIQAALTAAAALNAVVVIPAGTYLVNTALTIPNGLRGIHGRGGVLKAGGAIAVLSGQSIAGGGAANLDDCEIVNVKIDGNGFSADGIRIENGSGISVEGCHIYGSTGSCYGILFRSLAGTSQRNSTFIRVANNLVEIGGSPASKAGIALNILNADLQVSPSADELAYWDANFAAAPPTVYAEQCTVVGNVVNGGYYGIDITSCRRTTVVGNQVSNNTRGIVCQHGGQWNTITGNTVSQPDSSGIYLSFGTKDCAVVGNTVRGTSTGEALIQLRNGATDCLVSGNHVINDGATGNQYHIYVGLKSDRNSIVGNRCTGAAARAGICVESAWNEATAVAASYAFGKSAIPASNTNAAITAVTIADNIIDLSTAKPAIAIIAGTDDGSATGYDCDAIVVSGNHVQNNTPSKQLSIVEDGGNVSELSLLANTFHRAATASKFDQPRGHAHYLLRSGNAVLDDKTVVAFANGDTTPDVSFGSGFFNTSNTGATSITDFDGGADGQEIVVKLDVNTTLVHNNALMRLKGSVNIVSGSSNNIVKLISFAGIWFETARNF